MQRSEKLVYRLRDQQGVELNKRLDRRFERDPDTELKGPVGLIWETKEGHAR